MKTSYQKPLENGLCFSIDQFTLREKALKSRIFSLLQHTKTIFARKTIAQRIGKSTVKTLFNRNHIAGYAKAKFYYGLFMAEDLVAAISFAQGRNMAYNGKVIRSFEWVGFCSKNGFTIAGGLSKLISTFVEDKHPAHIVTFVDVDWARSNSLQKNGF